MVQGPEVFPTPFRFCNCKLVVVDNAMNSWITDYLTGRPQFAYLGSVLSDVVASDTEAPPPFFTLCTIDVQCNSVW